MSVLKYYDNTLHHKDNPHLEISIQAGLNGFSFVVYDRQDKKFKAFKHTPFENILHIENFTDKVKELLDSEDLLKLSFQNARIQYLTQKSILVPAEYFSPDRLKSYFEFNHSLNELDEMHYNYLPDTNAYNVFTIPSYFSNLIFRYFKQIKFYHQATSLIHLALNRFKDREKVILVNLNHNFFDIVVCEDHALKLYNSFMYQNSNDVSYFVLYVLKQLNLKAADQTIFLCGEHMLDRTIESELKHYIQTVEFLETGFYFIKSPELHRLNASKFVNIFNIMKCE